MNKAQQLIDICERLPDRPGTEDVGKWVKSKSTRVHSWTKEYPDGSFGTITKMVDVVNGKKNVYFEWGLGIEIPDTRDRERIDLAHETRTSGKDKTLNGAQNAADKAYEKWRKA